MLAIDPGSKTSALIEVDLDLIPVLFECLLIAGNDDIVRYLRCHPSKTDMLVIEGIQGFGQAVGHDVYRTAFEAGRFAGAYDGCYTIILRKTITAHLCGSARASDRQVRQVLIDRFGPVGTKKDRGPLYGMKSHLWSAFAVGVTYHDLSCLRSFRTKRQDPE